ncbi:MAG: toll/interleukin-1 receptor domain-containing protein, partial [bacterium]|nr:toll/interleukin-1 receptor domain-containing protein [bacterium]
DQEDPAYKLLRMALRGEGIDCWDPGSMKVGRNLGAQLRAAIEECSVCVFLATQNSVKSNWCLAELGAFWGARKPVIVYLADTAVSVSFR